MKKIMYIFGSLALMLGGAACDGSEPATRSGNPGDEPGEIQPVPVSEIGDEVAEFFETYLPISNDSRPSHEFNFGDVDALEAVCLIINSADEFRTIAPSSSELPSVDFEKYTLVIGQHPMGDPGYILKEQSMDAESNPMTLTLRYDSMEGPTPGIMTTFYYWGLYPKFPQKPLTVDVK